MNILLNLLLLGLGVIWFNQRQHAGTRKPVFPVMIAFVSATILVFLISLAMQSDYLDGFLYILSGGLSLVIFWIWTSASIIYKHTKMKTTGYILPDLAQNSILLIIPLILFFLVSDANLKIGG